MTTTPVNPLDVPLAADTLDTITARLQDGIAPQDAPWLMAPDLADGGLPHRLSNPLTTAAHYAQQRSDIHPELWQNPGLAAQDLRDWTEARENTAQWLGHLASTPRPQQASAPLPSAKTHAPAVPAPSAGPGRRR